jgi:GAF domain-containing protein
MKKGPTCMTTITVHKSFRLSRPKPKDAYHELRAWTATDRLAASNRLRAALGRDAGLKTAAEATAETIRELMVAKSVSIVLLDDRGYRDLVNIGQLARGEHRFPEDQPSAANYYPAATARLLGGESYVTIGSAHQLLTEYGKLPPGQSIGPVMGVPVMHAGEVWGEVFMLRDARAPGFTDADVDVACELAAQFGMQLPVLLHV